MMDGISGLQSLISRGMHGPSQKASIPPGLQALIQAQQALKQTAIPVTPAGTPTVAGQAEQAIQQQLQPSQPQMAQPQGMPGMMPSDPFREQLMKTLQMQAQQQMQPPGGGQPPEQPQQPPQPMAAGGIAGLPADNMARMEQYAHGGVIGFDGTTRSDVPDPLISQTSDTALQKIESEKAKNTRDLADKYKQSLSVMSAVANSGDQQAIQKYATSTQENLEALRNYVNTSYGNRADQVLNTVLSATAPVQEKPKYTYEEPVKAGASIGTQQRQVSPPTAPRGAQPSAVQSGAKQPAIAVPTLEDIYKRSDVLAGTNPKIQEIEDLNKKILDLQQKRPDLESQGIEALRAHEQQRKALLDKQRQGDIWNKITSYGQDLYERGGGNRLDKTIGAIDARDKADIDASLLSKQMELKLMDLAHQQKIGNLEGAQKRAKEVADLYEKRQQHLNNIVGYGAQIGTGVYSAQMTERTHAADRAQRERERLTHEKGIETSKNQSLLARLNEDIALKSAKLEEDLKKDMRYSVPISGAIGSKDPKAIEEGRKAEAAMKAEIEAKLKPLYDQREMVSRALMGTGWGQMTVTPNK